MSHESGPATVWQSLRGRRRAPDQRGSGEASTFPALWWSSTLSNLGDGVMLTAVPLLATSLTRDPTAVAAVAAAATLPWLLCGLPAGALVDRWDRLRVMRIVDVVRAVIVGALGVAIATDQANLAAIAATVFLLGCAETLFDSASMAILPTVVTDERLVWANGRLFAGELTANQFIGPPLGALLFVTSQAAPPFVDALTFAASALLLLGVRQRVPAQPPTPTSRRRLRQDVMEGLAFVWHNRDIRLLALGAAVINIAESATLAVLVLWVTGPIGLGAGGFGMVLTLGAIGGVVGSVLADRVVTRTGNRRSILAAVWCFSLGLGTIGVLTHPALTVIGIAVTGASAQLWNVVAVSYRQRQTPPALRGRVMSAYRVIAYGTYPVGAMFGGLVASVASVRTTFAVSAVIVGSLALGMQRWFGQVEVV